MTCPVPAPAPRWLISASATSLLNTRDRYRALSINGVADAIPVVIGFADWRIPGGATTPVFVIGSDLRAGGLQPWDLVEGRIEALTPSRAWKRRIAIRGFEQRRTLGRDVSDV